jgi:peptide deformylase
MAVLPMRRYGDPVLRQKAKPIGEITPEIRALIVDMVDTMHDEVGIGLAAPQVGVSIRLLVMDAGKGVTRALLNPRIVERRGSVVAEEGCLSLPGIFADVERSEWVKVEATGSDGQPMSLEASGLQARVVQHEMDHLDGVLFLDHLPTMQRDRIKRRIQKDGFSRDRDTTRHAFAL